MSTNSRLQEWLDICDAIDDGALDEGLNEIARAVQSRREVVSQRTARRLLRSLKAGDRVMLTNRITPRYLEGMVGSVKEVRDNGAAVGVLDTVPTPGRGRPPAEGLKKKLLVPLIHLQKLDDDISTLTEAEPDDIGDDDEYDDEE
jgi:hypothetical protein